MIGKMNVRFRTRLAYLSALVILGVWLLTGTQVLASTLTGATGLIAVPTADTLPAGVGEFAVHFHDHRLTAAVSYGFFDHVEIGANTRVKDASLDLGLMIKANLVTETARNPAVALGFETGRSYVVVSKLVAPRVRGTAGYALGDQSGPFAGVAVNLSTASVQGRAGIPPTTLMAEISPGRGLDVGARVLITPNFSADLMLLNMKDVGAGIAIRTQF